MATSQPHKRYRHLKLILFGFFIISTSPVFPVGNTDSLTISRNLLQQGKFHGAYKIIKSYSKDHPDDFNSTWLYAYTSYFVRHFHKSDQLYQKAMKADPDNYYLKLDYARMLVNVGSYNKARPILQSYLSYDSLDGVALVTRARLNYDEADYKNALIDLNKIPSKSNEFQYVGLVKQEINIARAPWILTRVGYSTDDQPLQGFYPEIRAGWSLHPLATMDLSLQVPVFLWDSSSSTGFWGQAGNTMFFAKPRIVFSVHLGILKFPKEKFITWTGDFALQKSFLRNIEMAFKAERSPYFSTISSIDSCVIENHFSFTLGLTDINSWHGKMNVEIRNYPIDQNNIFSLNGWVLAPPVKFSVIELRFGLGYNYSTSQKNNFVAKKGLPEILSDYNPATQIEGIYNPYFTPNDQSVGSFIAAFAIHLTKNINFDVNMNLGIISFAMIPYLYLDRNSSGDLYIARDFVGENYFPAEMTASLGFKLTPTIRLQADYNFSNTYYFIRHNIGLGLKLNLTNGN
ncbi:MAG: tetratricopeptide repeat protein [Bacteroidales bacterium]|nr:tetratricopeptide repeat protein [Bacteroidales bacterium]